jgi:putative endonuclease
MGLPFYVYILASARYGYLYIGHTDNLERRLIEHNNDVFPDAYTRKHHIKRLVYYETFETREEAKRREAILKKLARVKKFRLIEQDNPYWSDLASSWK